MQNLINNMSTSQCVCVQFSSCTVLNYWTHDQHGYYIKYQH